MKNKQFSRNCPNVNGNLKCKGLLYYSNKYTLQSAINKKTMCVSCSRYDINSSRTCNECGVLYNSNKNSKFCSMRCFGEHKSFKEIKKTNGEWIKYCNNCNEKQVYSSKNTLIAAMKNKSSCYGCSNNSPDRTKNRLSGVNHPFYGKHHSSETKAKIGKKNSGSYEYKYGKERAIFLKKQQSDLMRKISPFLIMNRQGENNGMYKKTHTEETKDKIRKKRIGYRHSDEMLYEIYIKKFGVSRVENEKHLSDYMVYRNKVVRMSERQPLDLLENYELRGNSENDGYHLDHIVPISYGFKNDISPEKISDISNLRFIPWLENIKKGNKLITEIKNGW